jgi:hemoglobin-like flavoprotein
MTSEQRQLLLQSWARIEQRGDECATIFYERLFELDPRTQALFAATDMAAQRAKFILMLGSIVRVLDDPDQLVPEGIALGRRHGDYGVRDGDYETVGQALLWMFERALGDDFDEPVRIAWGEGYRMLAALMQRAASRPKM